MVSGATPRRGLRVGGGASKVASSSQNTRNSLRPGGQYFRLNTGESSGLGGVRDPLIIAALLLDTVEDTETTPEELSGAFGSSVAAVVEEVTDVKWLSKRARKELQVARAGRASERAKQIKLADKICNYGSVSLGAQKWHVASGSGVDGSD
jgi:hypothetical protein